MADFSSSTTVNASSQALFDYLSDVSNLPKYFARMTSAKPGEGDEVKTTAKMPDGTEVQGDAWFTVDDSAQSIEWGSENNDSNYGGQLKIDADGDSSSVTVTLHTTRVEAGDSQVQDGLAETLANIKRLVEESGAA